MPQTVCRMFPNRRTADAAAADLRLHGYAHVHAFGGEAGSADTYTDALCKAFVLKAEARLMAPGLADGRGLVVVHTQFGTTGFALRLLDRHGPVESGVPARRAPGPRYDDAAPLSSAMQMPVLTRMTHPFEAFTSLPTLTKGSWTLSDAMQVDARSKRAAPLSNSLGLPLLTGAGCHPTAVLGPLVLDTPSHRPRPAPRA
jgi:hypothetical protein